MSSVPLLQCAMDYISLPPALAMSLMVAPEVDIIEIGTPLCKAAGLDAIRSVREVLPDKLILADFKSPDVGGLEAKMAFDAGADMMTVIGGAALATVESALEAARVAGKEMLMELTGVRDIIARAKEWRQIGVERMVYHRGWDGGGFNRQWGEEDRTTVRQLIDMGFKITVTGGITKEKLPFFQPLDVSVVICGRGIREAANPRLAAHEFRSEMQRLWGGVEPIAPAYAGGRAAGLAVADNAAKAVRWGVSEMGLLLTVDGRECPGCDAPQRFCYGTRTEIVLPPGVRADDVVTRIGQEFGRSNAFGRASDRTLFLDPAHLAGNGTGGMTHSLHNGLIDLLRATGNAVRSLGGQLDLNAGLAVADRILHEQ
jgi:3-hexulose-6-phosphate synthase